MVSRRPEGSAYPSCSCCVFKELNLRKPTCHSGHLFGVTVSGFLQGSVGKWLTGPCSSGTPLPIPGPAIAGSFLSGPSRGSSTAAVCLGIGSLAWVLKRKSEVSLPFDPGPCRVCRCYGSSVFLIASGMIRDGLPASQPQTSCPFGIRHKTASLVF